MLVVAALLLAQVAVQAPGMKVPERRATVNAELAAIAHGEHDRTGVFTRGHLSRLEGPWFALDQGTARVMVIPMPGTSGMLEDLLGRDVRVEGFVRRLYDRQGTCLQRMPQSYCDDPDLPPTPDRQGRPDWPRMSITVWSAADAESAAAERTTEGALADLLDGTAVGEVMMVRGRFCGVDLCGRAPTPMPQRGAWRIADGDVSIWVVGHPPRGKGWRLDPAYAGDASRWVEVTGTAAACGTQRCLKASKVALAPAPRPPDAR
jgi:hypothetical protein